MLRDTPRLFGPAGKRNHPEQERTDLRTLVVRDQDASFQTSWDLSGAPYNGNVRFPQHSGRARAHPGRLNPDCPDLGTGLGQLNGGYVGGSGR